MNKKLFFVLLLVASYNQFTSPMLNSQVQINLSKDFFNYDIFEAGEILTSYVDGGNFEEVEKMLLTQPNFYEGHIDYTLELIKNCDNDMNIGKLILEYMKKNELSFLPKGLNYTLTSPLGRENETRSLVLELLAKEIIQEDFLPKIKKDLEKALVCFGKNYYSGMEQFKDYRKELQKNYYKDFQKEIQELEKSAYVESLYQCFFEFLLASINLRFFSTLSQEKVKEIINDIPSDDYKYGSYTYKELGFKISPRAYAEKKCSAMSIVEKHYAIWNNIRKNVQLNSYEKNKITCSSEEIGEFLESFTNQKNWEKVEEILMLRSDIPKECILEVFMKAARLNTKMAKMALKYMQKNKICLSTSTIFFVLANACRGKNEEMTNFLLQPILDDIIEKNMQQNIKENIKQAFVWFIENNNVIPVNVEKNLEKEFENLKKSDLKKYDYVKSFFSCCFEFYCIFREWKKEANTLPDASYKFGNYSYKDLGFKMSPRTFFTKCYEKDFIKKISKY